MKNSKIKTIIVVMCCLLLGTLFISFKDRATVIDNKSKEYSKFEIDSAILSARLHFALTFKDCDLLTIGYAGDQSIDEAKEWAKEKYAWRVIILNSSFKSGSNWQDTGLEPDKVYENWEFIMVKRFGFLWLVETNGFG